MRAGIPATSFAGGKSVTLGSSSSMTTTDTDASPASPERSSARAVNASVFPASPGGTAYVNRYGGEGMAATGAPFSSKTTDATPTLSSARTSTVSLSPSTICDSSCGARNLTVGGWSSATTGTVTRGAED